MDAQELIAQRDAEIQERLTKADAVAAELRNRVHDLEQKGARRGGGGDGGDLSPGAQMIASPEFLALQKAGRGTARIKIETKATLTSAIGAGLIAPDARIDPILLPRRALRVRDLLTQSRTASNAVRYVVLASRSNSAAVVSEGDTKPEQTLDFDMLTADVQVIAAWVPASKQILDDAPQLASVIDGELRYAVAYAEEGELLNGDGSGVHLYGLVPQATSYSAPFTPQAPQMLDTLLLAKAQLEASDLTATGVILNPIDWAKLQALKNSQDAYLGGGPFSPDAPTVWGMSVVSSNSMAQDKALVGDFKRAGTIFDRTETVTEVSTEHSDFFTRNLCAVRTERRLALAVVQPSALLYLDFGNIT
jgi:HK97 family phage major capsid protein